MNVPASVLDLMMSDEEFQSYMLALEQTIFSPAIACGYLGKRETLPVRVGKLSRTGFGSKMGMIFDSTVSFAIDYYGMLKRSTALCVEIEFLKNELSGKQIKTIDCLVVHFASLRIEHVARFNSQLISCFPSFKQTVLEARGFKTKF